MGEAVEWVYGGDGERLDRFVARELAGVSRAQVQRWIADGAVTVDGRAAKASHRLARGEWVRATVPVCQPEVLLAVAMDLAVVYEDADCVVIDKPPGLVVHPATSHRQDTLVNGLLARYPEMGSMVDPATQRGRRPGIVHRLDKDTSGLIVVARTEPARRALQRQFQQRRVEKEYVALVHGRVSEVEGTIDLPIGRDPGNRKRMAVVAGGRPAQTAYTVRAYLRMPRGHREVYSLVAARPLTGRTHQIRVHFAQIGHPVVGDTTYGRRRRGIACPRQFLHAQRLGFQLPSDGREVAFVAPLPPDLASVLAGLETAD
ncbi:MAG: RluA family pseudouridine synthase [Anaerolineae bacterium]|nr:RluA family pseudouridine synthase [Anaerolineae bacterium]